jgi:hypothetical protein
MAETLESVLAALDGVAWASMVHCRGSAEDVPRLVRRAVAAEERLERGEARRALMDALFYQGSSFEPTGPAGAVLMRAMPLVDEAERAWFLRFAAALANAYTMTEGQGLLRWVPEGHPERAQVVAQHEREVVWAREARRAGWLAVPHLLGLIGSEREDLAMYAPHALVALLRAEDAAPDAASRQVVAGAAVSLIVAAASRGGPPKVVAGYAYALGNLAELVPSALDALRPFLEFDWPARTAAALHLAWRGDDRAADVLIEALARRAEHEDWFPYPFPWRFGHVRFVITRVLSHPGTSRAAFERAVPVFADVIARDTWNGGFEHDVLPPLHRALEGKDLAAMPPLARALLEAVRDSESFWAPPRIGNTDNAMRPLGLKNDREWFRAWLG